jgi:hypothetical protein
MIKLPEGLHEEQLIVLMKFGSHLYGTDGPDSDTDYKGVYMPTMEQILTQNVPKSYSSKPSKKGEGIRNTKDDVDVEIYSLHYFLKLAMDGQTVAIDMLHASYDWPEVSSAIWRDLRNHRMMFYTKNLKAFVGYARKQAAKYGIKGSRIADLKLVLDFLECNSMNNELRLADLWEDLPQGEHINIIFPIVLEENIGNPRPPRMYQVCGKSYQETAKVPYVFGIMQKQYDDYGHRAKLAADNKGIDWKAVSHALRAAYQLQDIYNDGDIHFPLKGNLYLRRVKDGIAPWAEVQRHLEETMEDVERLAKISGLPERVDRKYWDRWLVDILAKQPLPVVTIPVFTRGAI